MCVYTEGAGEKTLVFLSGSGICSPILDFRSLYSLLSGTCRIAVVEKFGYGFSDIVDGERPVDLVLDQTRTALLAAGVLPPYVLCPHSMSGIEALRWAQKYPEEVTAIIGLDMALPAHYAAMKPTRTSVMKLLKFAAEHGVTRIVPGEIGRWAVTLPMLLFISNGSGGTGFKAKSWRAPFGGAGQPTRIEPMRLRSVRSSFS